MSKQLATLNARLIYLNPSFSVEFIFGISSLIIISSALLFRKKELSLGMLLFALILSTFNALKFSEAFRLSFGFISLIPLILLIVLISFKLKELMHLGEKWFGAEPNELEKKHEDRIAFYKREFQNLSSEELIRRGNNDKLIEEARIAIDQLLKERQITMDSFMN